MHQFIYATALNDQLHTARLPFNGRPIRILDVGYGTGKWILDMAYKFPFAQVVGIDLVPFLIRNPFPNAIFLSPVDFFDEHWNGLGEASFDLVHLAQLCGSVADWEKVYGTVFRYA